MAQDKPSNTKKSDTKKNISKKNVKQGNQKNKEKMKVEEISLKAFPTKPTKKVVESNVFPKKETSKENQEIIVGLNRESQKSYKILTKIVAILALIGKILTAISIPLIVFASIFFIVIFNNVEYSENRLYFNNKEFAVFENDDDGVVLKINAVIDNKNITIRDNLVLKQIQALLDSVPNGVIVSGIVFATIFLEASLVIWVLVYRKLEELFNNLNTEDTPFTEKNTLCIKELGKLLIISAIILAIGNGLIEAIIRANVSIGNGSINIIGILVVYTIYYIFKYGTKLQSKSNMRIVNKD